MMTIFHQFDLAWVKLHHSIAFAMNPWISSTHWPLFTMFVGALVDYEAHIILGFDFHENGILRVGVLNHLGGCGMQVVMGRLLLRVDWVLMQKYLLLRFVNMKNKLFRWNT